MAKKEVKKENNKNKKSFFKDFKAELKKVSWPTPKQLVNNTIAVITIVIITAAIVFVLDLVFETLNKSGVDKIKEIVSSNQTEQVTDESTDNSTDENSIDVNTTNESTDTTTSEDTNANTENNAE